jgi:para-aminobenzoate synthetase/4-amino-4-deoxychorismate lyase
MPQAVLLRRELGWDLTPADVLRLVRRDAHPVALCGAWSGSPGAGADIVAAEPVAVRMAPGELGDVLDGDIGGLSDRSADSDGGAFGGGWIGYLGYRACGEAPPPAALAYTAPRALPSWWFGYYDHVLRRDRTTGQWCFEALCTPGRAAALDRRLAELSRRAAAGGQGHRQGQGCEFGPFRLNPGAAAHQAAVSAAVDYIRAGDIFQANITLRAEAEFSGDPLDAFCQGVTELDPPYAAFISVADGWQDGQPEASPPRRAAVASLSPELFLRRTGAVVTSKPIKGTARRGADEAQAKAQCAELAASVKNRAENVMIVDLVRNDLSRVCSPGSVTVPALLSPEPHPGVWHLVSTVTGTLRPGAGDGDLVRAAFPPGSVTGAPKVRALELIDELETGPREVYTGAIGYRSPAAGLELNVAIRTFEFAPGRAWIGAGGGIVADSDPAAEYAECLIKAAPLLRAVGASLEAGAAGAASDTRGGARVAGETRAAGAPDALGVRRPRPVSGVFTSLAVDSGETRGLDAHLARLAASVRDLYGKDLPESLAADLAECLRGGPAGRLRITVRPVGGPLQAKVEVVPSSAPAPGPSGAGVTLAVAVVPGGFGAHKYSDRRLLSDLAERAGRPAERAGDPAQQADGADRQVLLADETGEVLETDRANVFAVCDGVLLTPPSDGRILPGTTRAAVLRAAAERGMPTQSKPLTLGELAQASEVFVTNAVIGVRPVTTAGALAWPPGPVAAAMARALASRPPDPPTALWPPVLDSTWQRAEPPWERGATAVAMAGRRSALVPRQAAGGQARPLVILIDNYDSFTWNLAHLLDVAGAHVEVVRNDEVPVGQLIAAAPAGVVISPGPCAPAEAGISVAAVTACARRGVPLLGICLGHQAIAAAFGARVITAPRPVHGKAFRIAHDGRGVLTGVPDPFRAGRYHSLIVDEATLPADLTVTARSSGLPMGIRHRTLRIEGVQFHPESILTTHGAAMIANFTAQR